MLYVTQVKFIFAIYLTLTTANVSGVAMERGSGGDRHNFNGECKFVQ